MDGWEAVEEVIKKLTPRFVRRFSKAGMERDDAQQAARIAGWRALQRYDSSRGAALKTYLGYRIWGAMRDEAIRHARWYRGQPVEFDENENYND